MEIKLNYRSIKWKIKWNFDRKKLTNIRNIKA